MSLRRKFERKIREKEAEIQELEYQLRAARAYVQAMQDAMKLVPNDADGSDSENGSEVVVRPGSAIEAAIKVLRERGKPMHIMDLLPAIGREATPENRASVGSSLASYVRKGQIFTRPAPNTYGLVEWGTPTSTDPDDLPEDFGDGRAVDNA